MSEKIIPNFEELKEIFSKFDRQLEDGELFMKLIGMGDRLSIAEASAFFEYLKKQKFGKSLKKKTMKKRKAH